MHQRVAIGEEVGPKKAFAWASDWPGWCRSGKDASLARAALIAYAPRYAAVATVAGLAIPDMVVTDVEVVESVDGDASTDFGVPHAITDMDRRPATGVEAERLATLVEAAGTATRCSVTCSRPSMPTRAG